MRQIHCDRRQNQTKLSFLVLKWFSFVLDDEADLSMATMVGIFITQ